MNHIASLLPVFPQQFVTQPNINTHINNPTPMHATDFDDDFILDDIHTDLSSPAPSLSSSPIPQPNTTLPPQTAMQLEQMIVHIEEQLAMMKELLSGHQRGVSLTHETRMYPTLAPRREEEGKEQGEIIEGVFTGSEMLSTDGKSYPISPNYASKSKLIQGDILKLTISPSGAFLYKQIGPTMRKHIKGMLMYDAVKNQWTVLSEGRVYKLLTASVTFHKGQVGDTVVIIIPENGDSEWAALEHVIRA